MYLLIDFITLITQTYFVFMIAMKITLLGTGTSFVDSERVQSGILVEVANKKILFDVGSGILHRLTQTGIDITSIDCIFISHFHIDHCSDFPTLYQSLWMSGYDRPLRVYAPPAIKEWMRGIFEVALPYLQGKLEIEIVELDLVETVDIDGVVVTAQSTPHSTMDSRAFKIEYEGKSIVYTSDTSPCQEIIDLAKGADVLIHECNWLDDDRLPNVHTSPSELKEIATRTGTKKVVLVHLGPDVVGDKENVLQIIGSETEAEIIMGEDLLEINL
jgi:ribonuclease BN (tRNA processing enzyme)